MGASWKYWRLAGTSLLALLACLQLGAQIQEAECGDTPPEHVVDSNGAILPQYREWDPGSCNPAILERREFDRGMRAWRRGERQEAFERIKEAVRLDDRFVEALADLGGLALEYFNRALSVDQNAAKSHAARAGALVMLNRPEEAEAAARRALQLDPESVGAHYILGVALWMQNKSTQEAVLHLRLAVKAFPRAHGYLVEVQAALAREKTGR